MYLFFLCIYDTDIKIKFKQPNHSVKPVSESSAAIHKFVRNNFKI